MNNEKMTQKKIAQMFGISEKTARKDRQIGIASLALENALGKEVADKFIDIYREKNKNKKNGISDSQLISLSKQSPEVIRDIVEDILADPDDCKQVLREWLPVDERITVMLPQEVSQYYETQAKAKEMSKGKYISLVLQWFYMAEMEEKR